MRSLLFGVLAFLSSTIFAKDCITNPYRTDGFGAQYQTIIYSVIYAELNHKTFLYTPFHFLEHNYDNQPDYLEKKEWLVNMKGHFPLNSNVSLQKKISSTRYIKYFEKNLKECTKSKALQKLKIIFRENKEKNSYFDEQHFHVAVHVRRPNLYDNRIGGTDIPDSTYFNAMKALRKKYADKNLKFHIYSQGDPKNFKIYENEDVIFHINESVEDTFTSLVFADALMMAPSSLSYTAALLSNGVIYYLPFVHPPLSHWQSYPKIKKRE